jgi:3-deoxy-D-manno-octulosonic-acid transferase
VRHVPLRVLIKALRSELPGVRLLLTHGTATGRAEGRGLLQPGDLQCWATLGHRRVLSRGFCSTSNPRWGC